MCDLFGCIYNEDGICNYCKSNIKEESAKACNERNYD